MFNVAADRAFFIVAELLIHHVDDRALTFGANHDVASLWLCHVNIRTLVDFGGHFNTPNYATG